MHLRGTFGIIFISVGNPAASRVTIGPADPVMENSGDHMNMSYYGPTGIIYPQPYVYTYIQLLL